MRCKDRKKIHFANSARKNRHFLNRFRIKSLRTKKWAPISFTISNSTIYDKKIYDTIWFRNKKILSLHYIEKYKGFGQIWPEFFIFYYN